MVKRILNDADSAATEEVGGSALAELTKSRSQIELREKAAPLELFSGDEDWSTAPDAVSDRSTQNGGGRESGAGYDLAGVRGSEVQAGIKFCGEGVALRPGFEDAKLLIDDGSGPIFEGAANHRTVPPTVRRESQARQRHKRSIERNGEDG